MAKTTRPAPMNKPPAAPVPLTSGTTKPSPPAPAQRPPQPSTASPKPIEEQVDALLDKAQQQVQTMAELTSEKDPGSDSPESAPGAPAPPEATGPKSEPLAAASVGGSSAADGAAPAALGSSDESPEPVSGKTDDANAKGADEGAPPQPTVSADAPVDPAALQRQVDAILAEAGYPVGEPMPEAAVGATNEAPDDASPSASAAEVEEKFEQDVPPAPVDLSEVDAVIADAAQRAMEEEDFDAGAVAAREATDTVGSSAVGAQPASAGAAAPVRPKAVKKGGDASMRREKRKRKPPDVDLDGDFASTAPLTPTQEDGADESPEAADEELTFEHVAAVESPSQGWMELIRQQAMATLALANAPWHTWSVFTRYAVLAVTIGNGLLALIAFVVVLRRLL